MKPVRSVQGFAFRFFAWLGSHELGILWALAGIAAGAWIFAYIASEVVQGDTLAFDRSVLLSMRRSSDHMPLGPPSVQEAARDVTALGGTTVLTLLTAFTAVFLLLDGKKRMALFLCTSVSGGLLLSMLLKMLFNRPRPDIVPHGSYVFTTSFPSGHSMLSAVTYLTLEPSWRVPRIETA